MSAIKTPEAYASGEEWGALAVSICDWRWPWDNAKNIVCPPMPGWVCVAGCWRYTDDLQVAQHGDGLVLIPARFGLDKIDPGPRQEILPDPDHWAWEGWLLRLLGPCEVGHDDTDPTCGPWSVEIPGVFRMGVTIGRACIAAAAANGRWPGGGE